MLRIARRALLLFAGYLAVLLVVVFAGFLGSAVGIWASVLWGLVVVIASALIWRRRRRRAPAL